MKWRKLLALCLILIGGLYAADRLFLQKRGVASFEGQVQSSERARVFDLTDLESGELVKAAKIALVEGLQLKKRPGAVGLAWGQFLLNNESGGKVYACQKFPHFEMTLQAEGIANSGNIPTIIIRGPCISSDDGRHTVALMIPLKGLRESLRENAAYRVNLGEGGESFIMSAQYLYNDWPRYWNVIQIKLSSDAEILSMDGYEIISLLDQPLTLDFADEQ